VEREDHLSRREDVKMPRCVFHDKWCKYDGPHEGMCVHYGKGGRAVHYFSNDKYSDEYAGGHRIRPTLAPGIYRVLP